MRPIKKSELRRIALQSKLDALDAAKTAMAGMTDQERADYISANDALWTALRHDLWKVGSQKCWYSEVVMEADAGEVEHFRPKKKVWKSVPPHGGYWWRAFDWTNFRLAHPLVNRRRKDYSTEHVAGKGCYFPLRDEVTRATSEAGEDGEEPVLLDPANPSDFRLICFDENSGRPVPRYPKADQGDAWLHDRAEHTINFYHLNEGTWNAKRADLMRDVAIACDRAMEAKAAGNVAELQKYIGQIMEFIDDAAEFSAAARQMAGEKGLLNHIYAPPPPTVPAQLPAADS